MLALSKSDDQLITLALSGSQRSWLKLVRRHEGSIYNYCLRMCSDRSEAMDLMQEVFLTVYRNLPSYRRQDQFKAWIMRIASNKAIDFFRQRQWLPLHYAEDIDGPDAIPLHSTEYDNPDYQHDLTNTRQLVHHIMRKLPVEQRILVELKFFQHLTFEEISQQLNVPVNTVKTRLYTALHKLKEQTEKHHVL